MSLSDRSCILTALRLVFDTAAVQKKNSPH